MTGQRDLDQVAVWLEQDEFERPLLGLRFVQLLKVLIEAEEPEEWDPAIDVAHLFLETMARRLELGLDWPDADFAKLFSALLTLMAEAGQYRHETYSGDSGRRRLLDQNLLPKMGALREHAIQVAKDYLRQPVFAALQESIEWEIFPLLESLGDTSGERSSLAVDRFMPFRVIQIGNVVEGLYGFRLRTTDPRLVGDAGTAGLLRQIYDRKYARFGTSGVRGRWGLDFTEVRAKRVVQAICDFLTDSDVPAYVGAEDLHGKRMIIGYDSRKNARRVAEWTAQVCLANGFQVDFANRDSPTPALVYYLTDYLDREDVAGLINCTASHNPPEWQGVKFNPREGYPAPTSLTDFIAARANQLQLLDEQVAEADLSEAERRNDLRGFDPIVHYTQWILESGEGDERISVDPQRIRNHFREGTVIVDEMYGTSRGYLSRLLGEIGIRYRVIHAERNPNLPGLDYANPEEPFISTLKETVRESADALLGLGMDTDADRFGVVDSDGTYYRPNQILPMLVKYLGVDRGLKGRVVVTQTGSPLNEKLAGLIPGNEQNEPEPGVVPAYISHPFYHRIVGEREDRVYEHVFMVPVGIKYIEEQRRTDRRYRFLKELPEGWRDTILIGGEESSGLTTRGHVTDKDGVWANLLIMDMIAYYGKTVAEIWADTTDLAGWTSYGGLQPSNSGRVDVDAVLEAKENLINDFLDRFKGKKPGEAKLAGLDVIYVGGIRYDFVEIQLRDEEGDAHHYLRVRASGTEPINRIYVESSDADVARRLMETALQHLEELSSTEIRKAYSQWRLAEILSVTRPAPALIRAARSVVDARHDWSYDQVVARLRQLLPLVEHRNQRKIRAWIAALNDEAS